MDVVVAGETEGETTAVGAVTVEEAVEGVEVRGIPDAPRTMLGVFALRDRTLPMYALVRVLDLAERSNWRGRRELLEVGELEVMPARPRSASVERDRKVAESPRRRGGRPRQRSTATLGRRGNGENWLVGRLPTKAWHHYPDSPDGDRVTGDLATGDLATGNWERARGDCGIIRM